MITPFLGVLLGAWKNWSTFSHLFNFLHDWWLFNCTICHEVWECRRPTWGNEKLSLCFYITHCFFFFLRRYNTLISLVSFCSQIYSSHINIYIYIYILIFFLFSASSLSLPPSKNCAQHSYMYSKHHLKTIN